MPRKYSGPLLPGSKSAKVPKGLVRAKPPRKYQPKYKLSKPMNKAVEAKINALEETNEKMYQTALRGLPNQPVGNNQLFRLLPDIHQSGQSSGGTSVYPVNRETRTGTKVRLLSHNIKGRVFIEADDQAESSDRACISCRLLVLSCKKYGKFQDVEDNWGAGNNIQNGLLRNGSEQDNFDGYQFGLDLPVNSELFTTHKDMKFVMNRGQLLTKTPVPVPGTEGLGYAHMPFMLKYFNFNIKCKNKHLLYSDEENALPSNYAPFAVLCWAYTNGAAPSISRVPQMQITTKTRWKNM